MHQVDILSDIGVAIVCATVAALLARVLRQPLILGYLAAGVLVGPELGFGLVHARESVHVISELGLILLHSAHHMAEVIRTALQDGLTLLKADDAAALRSRDEVLA